MKVFAFDPDHYKESYAKNGWVVIRNGVDAGFYETASRQVYDMIGIEEKSMSEWKFAHKKRQFLFEFPSASDFPGGVYDVVSAVTGLDRERLTLCERHVKVYDSSADPNPPPHKDRLASEVAVGIPFSDAGDSALIIYPDRHTEVNPFQSTAEWNNTLDEEDSPVRLLQDHQPVRVHIGPRDVVMFRGSALYHERINGANSVILYLKLNAMRLDPIGEDPSTPILESGSEMLLSRSGNVPIQAQVELSPRLEKIVRYYSRENWREVLLANNWGEKPFRLSEAEFALLRRLDRRMSVADLLAACEGLFASAEEARASVGRLARKRALLFSPPAAKGA